MKPSRRAVLSLSLLLVPALVLNPAPASARVLDPGSPVTSWGNNGVVELWETGADGYVAITNRDVFEDTSGRYVFAAYEAVGVTDLVSVRAISADGSQAFNYSLPETAFDYTSVSKFDIDASGNYIVGAEVVLNGIPEFVLTRLNSNGSIDSSFASQGVFNFTARINTYLNAASSGCSGQTNVKDVAVDPLDSSIYVLAVVNAAGCSISGFNSQQMRLWKIDSSGIVDTSFGTSTLEAFPIAGDSGISPFDGGRTAIIKTYDGLKLSLMATGHDQVNTSNFELFHQEIDISSALPSAISQVNQKIYNSSTEQSDLSIVDFEIRSDGKIFMLVSESIGNTFYSNFMLLNPLSNRWDYIESQSNCTFESLAIDALDNAYVSKECGISDSSYTDSISKYSSLGVMQTNFRGPQGNFGTRSAIDYYRNKLFVDSNNVTSIGTASNRFGQPATSFVFGTRYHVNSVTIPDPPAPVLEPVASPAPAPAPAPALATQSAPVAVAAVVKAKKKISFPLKSAAGNPLIVKVSGSCSLSPVFKTVKVKVGKKTKKVKQKTGWSVQMKKKKKTCTITQTDAGGNGYAALSSSNTVTIK